MNAQAAWVSDQSGTGPQSIIQSGVEHSRELAQSAERNRALANWDPSYLNERVDWYGEFVARHAPISMSWLQPANKNQNLDDEVLEAKGLGLYRKDHVIAPLGDGSVCVWDIGNGSLNTKVGSLRARSQPGTLNSKEPMLKGATSAINGVVSVDNDRDKAYMAVQNYLQEIDLHTLALSSQQRFPWAIATLSDICPNVPLTVGTKSSLHLFDPRQRVHGDGFGSTFEGVNNTPSLRSASYGTSYGNEGNNHASLLQPGPTSILHLYPHGSAPDGTRGEIIVAGRFPSLLIYDRRTFPRPCNTFHSGAKLCGLASLPYSFRSLEADLMRQNQLSVRAAQDAKSQAGDTLFACGEYQGKGSLEIYGLSNDRGYSSARRTPTGTAQISTYKNRVSASPSKLLSIAVHGTRIVVSDGDGQVRWLERDGQTLVRKWNINKFGSVGENLMANYGSPNGDVALKLLPVHKSIAEASNIQEDSILVWTGEKIGLIGFSKHPRFGGDDGQAWKERIESVEEAMKRREEKVYGETMRRALERQADEVRWVSGLGLGG